jgi:hypothetical protein
MPNSLKIGLVCSKYELNVIRRTLNLNSAVVGITPHQIAVNKIWIDQCLIN